MQDFAPLGRLFICDFCISPHCIILYVPAVHIRPDLTKVIHVNVIVVTHKHLDRASA